MINVTLVGTGGMLPLKDRFMASAYIEHDGHAVLIDCGEGTQISMRRLGLKMNRIDAILITHAHGDHTFGLPGLLLSMSSGCRKAPVDLFYPMEAEPIIKGLLLSCTSLGFELNLNPLSVNESETFKYPAVDENLTISTAVLRHNAFCLGYKLRFDKKREFLPDKAKALDIPLRFYRALHSGKTAMLPDGRTILPEQVLGPPRVPTVIVNVTDSVPFSGIAEFARNASLLICEGMYGDEGMGQAVYEKGHMLMQDACRIAKEANVKKLFLTHYSPANTDPWKYQDELEKIFPNVVISCDGESITLQ